MLIPVPSCSEAVPAGINIHKFQGSGEACSTSTGACSKDTYIPKLFFILKIPYR